MQRIQKAVLKAKKAKQDKEVPLRPPLVKATSPLERLCYTQTRIQPCHPDKLLNNRIIAGFSNNENSQVFRTLRTQVLQKMRENNFKSLAITSPSEGEGKSIVAANLAIAIAMEVNQTVLLVDMDLKQPHLGDMFDIQQEKGLLDYVKGDVGLEDILVNPGIDRLVLVPGRGAIINSSELISSPKMVAFFAETCERYQSRFVIYDMPPILPSDDVLSSIGNIDSALLVLEDGKNSEKDIVSAVTQLQNTALLGSVVNRFQRGGWRL